MELIDIKRQALVMDSKEKEKLLQILRYCRHRMMEHEKLNAGDSKFCQYMIAFLEEMGK